MGSVKHGSESSNVSRGWSIPTRKSFREATAVERRLLATELRRLADLFESCAWGYVETKRTWRVWVLCRALEAICAGEWVSRQDKDKRTFMIPNWDLV